jgi:hypothetical protein
MLGAQPYDVLVGHSGGKLLRDIQISPTRFVQLVGFTDTGRNAGRSSLVFSWALRLQEDGAFKGCWMTDSVQPVGS